MRTAQLQVGLWHVQEDIYTSRRFYQHALTSAVTYTAPSLHHYLPPNFTVPEPLPRHYYARDLAGLGDSSSSSSEESLGQWQRRYGGDRKRFAREMAQEEEEEEEEEEADRRRGRAKRASDDDGDSAVEEEREEEEREEEGSSGGRLRLPSIASAQPLPAGSAALQPLRPASRPSARLLLRLPILPPEQEQEQEQPGAAEHASYYSRAFQRAVQWAEAVIRSPAYLAYIGEAGEELRSRPAAAPALWQEKPDDLGTRQARPAGWFGSVLDPPLPF